MGHCIKVPPPPSYVLCVLGYLRISFQDSFKSEAFFNTVRAVGSRLRQALVLCYWNINLTCMWREVAEVMGGGSSSQRMQGAKLPGNCGGEGLPVIELCSFSVNWFSNGLCVIVSPGLSAFYTCHLLQRRILPSPCTTLTGKPGIKRPASYFWEEMWLRGTVQRWEWRIKLSSLLMRLLNAL